MCGRTLFLLLAILHLDSLTGEPVVQLPTGKIRGQQATTFQNKTYYRFEGIPYAAPPVGPLRFKAPQPPPNWDDTKNLTSVQTICFQTTLNLDSESEDCLFINVYTPQLPDSDDFKPLPVMFHIYGGGFTDGFFQLYNPDLFVNNDVVFVSHNYRVGVFGFLSTQDEVIPGNNGLKDQQFALQWTHDNIHLFGGDPNKTTIFGESAGSASVSYQLLNRENEGLFQAAILGSGTFLSPWALQRNAREVAFGTAAQIDPSFANSSDSQALADFLQQVDARELDTASEQYHFIGTGPNNLDMGYFWAPVIEAKNPDAFLTRKMYGLLQAQNIIAVPLIIGMTSEEALYFNQDPEALKSLLENYDDHIEWIVPSDMQITNENQREEVGRQIRDLYTGGQPLADNLGDGVRYSSDNFFTRPIIKFTELYSKLAKTYFYQLSYSGQLSLTPPIHYDGAGSVAHGDDVTKLFCLVDANCDDSSYPESDQTVRNRLIKLWTDFAKYQNPTSVPSDLLQNVTWPLVDTEHDNLLYLDINEDLQVKNHPKEQTYRGWTGLYDNLDYQDFDTY